MRKKHQGDMREVKNLKQEDLKKYRNKRKFESEFKFENEFDEILDNEDIPEKFTDGNR